MTRSPIEQMVDRACGIDPNAPTPESETAMHTRVVLNACTALVEWSKACDEGGTPVGMVAAERALRHAALELREAGW